jgi:guanylate cyclase
LLPFLLQIALGGFIESSAVVLWSLIAPMGALIFEGPRKSAGWFAAFLAIVILSGFLQGRVDRVNKLPPLLVISFFVLNIGAISAIMFGLLYFFISQRERALELLRLEEEKSNNLLLNILPQEIAVKLKNNPGTLADHYDAVTILFADMVNFTPLSAELPPREMVGILNEIFSFFDSLVDEYGVEKIETVGDEYMAACGVPRPSPDHARQVARLALHMCDYMENFRTINGRKLQIRVGIHSGPIVAGVIGKKKFAFELFGDTVNTANRMQSHGVPGKIQVTRETYELLKNDFVCEPRGKIEVKGKGNMETWFLVGEKALAG